MPRLRRRSCSRMTRCRTWVSNVVGELDQVEGIHADHGGRQLLAQRLAEGRRRVEATTSTPSRQAELRAASQAFPARVPASFTTNHQEACYAALRCLSGQTSIGWPELACRTHHYADAIAPAPSTVTNGASFEHAARVILSPRHQQQE
jgi:hypothetical protein